MPGSAFPNTNNNYELLIGKQKATFHINSLRKYNEPQTEQSQETVQVVIPNELMTDSLMDGLIDGASGKGGPRDVQTGDQLTNMQKDRIRELLDRFPDVFTDKPGKTNLTEHVIKVTDEIPVFQAAYPIPEAMRDKVEVELQEMLANDIIQYDYDTKYSSPVVVIKKPNGNLRLCNNFIELNKKTINEQYNMTTSRELLSRVAGAKLISHIDIRSAYFQIKLSKESQKYTGFQTPFGVFSYKMMPMGLKTSSATCQKLMDRILRGTHKFAGTLVDDIIVYSAEFNDHLKHVEQILERLRQAGLTANAQKCCVASNNIKILGHIVRDGNIYPDDDKVKAVKEWAIPKTKRQLKSFLGLTGYFRDHISHYAAKALPLTEQLLRSKPEKLKWGPPQQESFDELKRALISKPVLMAADPNKPFHLYADTSKHTQSAILMQVDDDETKPNRVISYASRKLLPREMNYAIIELEILAIVYGLKHFHQWVYDREVIIHSDHSPLKFLNTLTKHSPRLARWILILQQYKIQMCYVPGNQQLADHLTRVD